MAADSLATGRSKLSLWVGEITSRSMQDQVTSQITGCLIAPVVRACLTLQSHLHKWSDTHKILKQCFSMFVSLLYLHGLFIVSSTRCNWQWYPFGRPDVRHKTLVKRFRVKGELINCVKSTHWNSACWAETPSTVLSHCISGLTTRWWWSEGPLSTTDCTNNTGWETLSSGNECHKLLSFGKIAKDQAHC